MVRSMTGYGAASLDGPELRASVTARSLNHRFLDITLHIPRRLQPIEMELRERIGRAVPRGRVEVAVQVAWADATSCTVVASRPLVASLVRALRDMQNEFGLDGGASVTDLVRFPGALERIEDVKAPAPELREAVLSVLDRALDDLNGMRQTEGARLAAELERALAVVLASADRIEERSEASREERRVALRDRLAALVSDLGFEEGRLYQEAARAVERHDVSEEIQRLRSHTAAAGELLAGAEAREGLPGKRLDFLAQELMREANTIGSKVQDALTIQEVVRLKSEIERFREQVQNVE